MSAARRGDADVHRRANILVVSDESSPELAVLEHLPPGATIVGVGRQLSDFEHLNNAEWEGVNVLINGGVHEKAGKREHIQALWPKLSNLEWMHSALAGLEKLLFPELVNSDVLLTNSKGVYSHSLAEYSLTACSWFAKDLPRLQKQKAQRVWEQYDVEELRGKVLGVIGYGDIGKACARIAKAFAMRIVALRSSGSKKPEEGVEKCYGPEGLHQLMQESDYVILATPYTPETHHLVNASAIRAMKPNAVFVNIGRGQCVEEEALTEALIERRIKGAALDVFETEPLPKESPLWTLDNVLLSLIVRIVPKNFNIRRWSFS